MILLSIFKILHRFQEVTLVFYSAFTDRIGIPSQHVLEKETVYYLWFIMVLGVKEENCVCIRIDLP